MGRIFSKGVSLNNGEDEKNHSERKKYNDTEDNKTFGNRCEMGQSAMKINHLKTLKEQNYEESNVLQELTLKPVLFSKIPINSSSISKKVPGLCKFSTGKSTLQINNSYKNSLSGPSLMNDSLDNPCELRVSSVDAAVTSLKKNTNVISEVEQQMLRNNINMGNSTSIEHGKNIPEIQKIVHSKIRRINFNHTSTSHSVINHGNSDKEKTNRTIDNADTVKGNLNLNDKAQNNSNFSKSTKEVAGDVKDYVASNAASLLSVDSENPCAVENKEQILELNVEELQKNVDSETMINLKSPRATSLREDAKETSIENYTFCTENTFRNEYSGNNLKNDSNVDENLKLHKQMKSLLKAPPPTVEEGSVLIERIIPVGRSQDLVSYSKTQKPSSAFYLAPHHVPMTDCENKLPPYRHISTIVDIVQDSYELGDVGEGGPQEWSSFQTEMKPEFDKSDFVPAAEWLDIDYKYARYFENDPITEDFKIRKKFNFDDYTKGFTKEGEKLYLKILEDIDATPNLGIDPETMNAFWLKETILRVLEQSGKYDTKYYDKEGNEYSLRSSKPSYALQEWAKEYLSTVPPPQQQQNTMDENMVRDEGYMLFQKVDKRIRARKAGVQPKNQSSKSLNKLREKETNKYDTFKSSVEKKQVINATPKEKPKNLYKKKVNHEGNLNIIPEERQDEIYNMLSTSDGAAQALESIMTPENEMKIMKELMKPTLDEPDTENGAAISSNNVNGPNLENIYEILLGDDIKEKQAIYDMMKTPAGKETVYEALCRIGSEQYPDLYESYDEDEDIYPTGKSLHDKMKEKKLLSEDGKKKEKRKIVIQTHPFPHEVPHKLSPEELAMYDETIDDPNDIDHNPAKQQNVFEVLRMSDMLNPQNPEPQEPELSSTLAPSIENSRTDHKNIDEILSSLNLQNEVYDMLKTSYGRQKVLDALCRIGQQVNPN